jgi:hypothetical protein
MLSTHSCTVHEQLLKAFIQLRLLERVPLTAYYRIVNAQVNGVFTPVTSCYSSTCNYQRPCYSPCCPLQKAQSDLFTVRRSVEKPCIVLTPFFVSSRQTLGYNEYLNISYRRLIETSSCDKLPLLIFYPWNKVTWPIFTC